MDEGAAKPLLQKTSKHSNTLINISLCTEHPVSDHKDRKRNRVCVSQLLEADELDESRRHFFYALASSRIDFVQHWLTRMREVKKTRKRRDGA